MINISVLTSVSDFQITKADVGYARDQPNIIIIIIRDEA